MHKLIIPLYFASVISAFLLGADSRPPSGKTFSAPVKAERLIHVLPDSRELTSATIRRTLSF